MGRRATGVSSSLTPSAKTKLWKRLRRLDKQITHMDRWLKVRMAIIAHMPSTQTKIEQRNKLDLKRKMVRLKLKGTI